MQIIKRVNLLTKSKFDSRSIRLVLQTPSLLCILELQPNEQLNQTQGKLCLKRGFLIKNSYRSKIYTFGCRIRHKDFQIGRQCFWFLTIGAS